MKTTILLIGGLVTTLIATFVKEKPWAKWATAFVALLICVLGIRTAASERHEAEIKAQSSADVRLGQSPQLTPGRPIRVRIVVGGTHAGFIFEGFEGVPVNLFDIFDAGRVTPAPPKNDLFDTIYQNVRFAVRMVDGKPRVSSIVRDYRGTVVATFDDNVVHCVRCGDKNTTIGHDAVEVLDENGDVAMQVSVHEDVVEVQGMFYDGDGRGLILRANPEGIGASLTLQPPNPRELKIVPIFKYPSSKFLGVLVHPRE